MKLDLKRNPERPLYLRLSEQLKKQVEQGILKPGDRLPSFSMLRREYGVHKNTIERAHMLLEQEGLIVRQSGAGTFVSQPCRAKNARLKSGRLKSNGVIGLAGFGFRFTGLSSYWAELLSGMQEVAEQGEQQILLLGNNPPDLWEKADGIIICDWSDKEILRYVPAQLPCVSLFLNAEKMASVGVDEHAAAQQATRHLLELGHKKIAYLSGGDATIAARRVTGFKSAMKEAGLKTPLRRHRRIAALAGYDVQFIQAGHCAMQQWLEDDWKALGCTALICHNDSIAIGAMSALRAKGVLPPCDLSVIGFDGLEIGNHITPRLSTIEIPLRQIGAAAVEMLSRQIAADEVKIQNKVLPTQLRARESTATPSRTL